MTLFGTSSAKLGKGDVIMRSSHEIATTVIMCLNLELEVALGPRSKHKENMAKIKIKYIFGRDLLIFTLGIKLAYLKFFNSFE